MSENLKNCRESSGLSQVEVAERLGITRQTLSRWEAGQTVPDARTLSALARLYGKTVDALLHGDPEESTEELAEELVAELPVEALEEQLVDPLALDPDALSTAQKKALSPKTRALLLVLAVLLGLVLSFAAGWHAHAYVQSHRVYEGQIDLSEPHGTLELFPLEDD